MSEGEVLMPTPVQTPQPSEGPSAPAQPRPPRAAAPLLVAAGLALLAHGLTVGTGGSLGLNTVLWVALFAGGSAVFVRRQGGRPTGEALTLLGLALAFAATFAVWDAPPLFAFLNGLALLLTLVLGAASLRFPGLGTAGVGQLIGTAFTGGTRFLYGPLVLLERFPWARLRPREGSSLGRVGLGLGLTVPVLLVFGGLLAGADGGFARLLTTLFDWRLEGLTETLFKLLGWSVLAGGLVYPALMALRPTLFPAGTPGAWERLGLIEIGLPLVALALLFVVFVGTQLPYFLSGTTLPEGLTFADYVRRGFEELLTVAFLTLGLLLSAHSLTRGAERARPGYRLLNLAVLLPLALILLSAANRWRLYTLAYGLSEIRVLGAALLVWLVLALAWLGLGLWRGDLRRFAYPALLAGLGLLLLTTALNPGGLIARVNVERDRAGVTNDLRRTPQQANGAELLALGADAVPVIVANLDTFSRKCGPTENCVKDLNDRDVLLGELHERYGAPGDPRTWNASFMRAHRLVQALPPGDAPTRN